LLPDKEALESLAKYGYYTTKVPDTNIKIIALISQIYDAMNWFTMRNATDPYQ